MANVGDIGGPQEIGQNRRCNAGHGRDHNHRAGAVAQQWVDLAAQVGIGDDVSTNGKGQARMMDA